MTLSAVLLTGGESRRMGRDKAEIIFESEPLWRRQLRLLETLSPQEIFLSARRSLEWHPANLTVIFDVPPSCGPLSGLTRTVAKMQTTHLLALAVDMPFMTNAMLKTLWQKASLGCGILPMISDCAEPLAAIYPIETAIDFQSAMAGADHSLQSLVRDLIKRKLVARFEVAADEQKYFRSVNEPADVPRQARAQEDSNLRPTD
jgi:molybdopterin-guanine dinucleotide biosynthesis protein A